MANWCLPGGNRAAAPRPLIMNAHLETRRSLARELLPHAAPRTQRPRKLRYCGSPSARHYQALLLKAAIVGAVLLVLT